MPPHLRAGGGAPCCSVCRCSMGLASCQALATALETPFVALQVRIGFRPSGFGAQRSFSEEFSCAAVDAAGTLAWEGAFGGNGLRRVDCTGRRAVCITHSSTAPPVGVFVCSGARPAVERDRRPRSAGKANVQQSTYLGSGAPQSAQAHSAVGPLGRCSWLPSGSTSPSCRWSSAIIGSARPPAWFSTTPCDGPLRTYSRTKPAGAQATMPA